MRSLCIFAAAATLLVALAASAADVAMRTQSWKNSDPDFEEFARQIEANFPRNLLARRGVRVVSDGGLGAEGVQYLADGSAGERCGDGRATINGTPSVITVYLGQPKTITQVGVYTFNGDRRANQDFEVRFADNRKSPGQKPPFPKEPTFTSGPKLLGKDGGGFLTVFAAKSGRSILPGKADWVEFRIWRTYSLAAGSPAKGKNASGWSALIELEVLGTKDDLMPAKEMARLAAIRKAPRKPDYEKRATWQQTMLAAREAIVRWETEQDRLALSDSIASFGPWHLAGPFPANSKDLRAV